MTSKSQRIAEQVADLRKLNEATERMRVALSLPPQNTIAMEDLQFLEVPFLKPTSKNPRVRKA